MDFFYCVVVFGQAAEYLQGLLAALDTAALAIKDFLNTLAEFVFPIGIILFGVLIVERSDAIPNWLVP